MILHVNLHRSLIIKYLTSLFLILFFAQSLGCAGSQLTPEEDQKYNNLLEEQRQISEERAQLAQQVKRDFAESGRIEKQKKSK